ncbi:hypothetical protein LEMLEM_LOCUS21110 [Lemmus lemmus]
MVACGHCGHSPEAAAHVQAERLPAPTAAPAGLASRRTRGRRPRSPPCTANRQSAARTRPRDSGDWHRPLARGRAACTCQAHLDPRTASPAPLTYRPRPGTPEEQSCPLPHSKGQSLSGRCAEKCRYRIPEPYHQLYQYPFLNTPPQPGC